MSFQSTILIVPGLGGSGPQHWQSIWEKQFNFKRIEQQNWNTPVSSDWIENINTEVNKHDSSQLILVGHSLGCIAIAYWAQKFDIKIKSALLVAPCDTEAASFPTGTTGFIPVPTIKLPFPSIVVTSNNDNYVTTERAQFFANNWGAEFANVGNAGHINVTSGFGEWDEGLVYLEQLDKAI